MRAEKKEFSISRTAAVCAAFLLCLFATVRPAQAARRSMDSGSISIQSTKTRSVDASFTLYKVGSWSSDGQSYVLDPALASGSQSVDLADVSGHEQEQADTLDAMVRSAGNSIKPVVPSKTIRVSGGNSALLADGLDLGLYILEGRSGNLVMNPVLISLPDKNGKNVTVEATKFSASGSLSAIRIVKLWKNTSAGKRPRSVTVRVTYKDGTNKAVTLSDANKWTATLPASEFGVTGISRISDWSVTEQKGSADFTASIQVPTSADSGNTASWYVVNEGRKDTPRESGSAGKKPAAVKTGDPTDISVWILILAVSGMAAALLGWGLFRRDGDGSAEDQRNR